MMIRALMVAVFLMASPSLFAQTVVALDDDNNLLRFARSAPSVIVASTPVSGLQAGESLVGIDRRPATGDLYALADSGRLYVVDPSSGTATLASTLDQPLTGAFFGVDFNPVPDRLRVVSDSGQNLRINVDTGETIVDGAINPAGPMLGGAGYINSVAGAMSTALYVIDVMSSSLFLQNPPNDGTLEAIGPLGVVLDAGDGVAFDVLTLGGIDLPHAILRVGGQSALYEVDLAIGDVAPLGAIGGNPVVRGMAIYDSPIAGPGGTATVVGLDEGNRLIRFANTQPGAILATTEVTGLQAGESLIGIDIRPATGVLYGLTDGNRLYTIDPSTGAAALASTLSVALSGSFFGMDFNPVPDRLRVVSDSGQNLRINVDTGETIVDGAINPAGPMLGGAGYINSVAGASSTALYVIDVMSSSLFLQNPPNDGTLVNIGALGVSLDAGDGVAFDVLTAGSVDLPHAILRVGGQTGIYTVDLASGSVNLLGAVGGNPVLRGMAIFAAPVPSPVPATATGIGLSAGNSLIRFPIAMPGSVQAPTAITGLQGGDTLVGIDFRPATGALYGLATSGRLYTINPATGAATLATTLDVALDGSSFAMDFNPVPDRLRVISNTGQNLRINVDTGETLVDGPINPAGPQITAAAYTNSVAGAMSTALFNIDVASGNLFLQNPPNDGTQVAIGPLGVVPGANAGFDILSGNGGNTPLAALTVSGSTGLYRIDLASGQATLLGAIAGNPSLVGFAVSPDAIGGGEPPPPPPPPPGQAQAVPVDSPIALLLLMLMIGLVATISLRRNG